MELLTRLKSKLEPLTDRIRHMVLPSRTQGPIEGSLSGRVLHAMDDAILVTDMALKIVEINPAFTRVTGYSRKEALGQAPGMLSSGRHDKKFYEGLWHSLISNGYWKGTIWNRRKNREVYPEWLSINTIKDTSGEATHYLATFSDLSHQKSFQNQIHLLAYYDSLTGLPNRELFSDRLNLSISQAHRDLGMLALFFLDLDHFKAINDSLGHSTGDQLLRSIATRLSSSLRESDTVARLGGDEFTVILSGITGHEHASAMAKKIQGCFKQPFQIGQRKLFIGTSIGISLYPEHGNDTETLLRHADSAMYRAKENGKNQYFIYDASIRSQYEHQIALENDLREALDNNQLKLVFQPLIDLSTGKITTLEALVRWRHQERGEISPNLFIPLADETGLTLQLGDWILDTACRQMAEWLRHKTNLDIRLALNISAQQLGSEQFMGRIESTLQQNGLVPQALVLEIPESTLMNDSQIVIESLKKITALGVQIAINDFGIGFSSLINIKRLSIDQLKIDESLVQDLDSDDGHQQLLMTVINMAHNLGLIVSAKAIENQEQLNLLKRLGCDQAQGHLISPPLPIEELTSIQIDNRHEYDHLESPYPLMTDSCMETE